MRATRAAAAVVALAACAAYADSFRGVFLLDDVPHLVHSTAIRRLWPPVALWWNSLRPLTFYSFAVSHAIGGYEVAAYHAMNLAFHVAAALTLLAAARRALRLPRVGLGESESSTVAFAIALLWAVHPLNTQAVTYVMQRAEVMAGLGSLLSLYCLLRAVEAESPAGRRRWHVATALAFYAALGSKEVAATTPVALWLFDALVVTGSFAEPLRRRRGLYFALAAPFVLVPLLWLAVASWRFGTLQPTPDSLPPLEYASVQPAVIVGYLRRVVWPAGLNFDHAWDPAQHGAGLAWGWAIVGAAFVATAVGLRRRAPIAWLPAAYFLGLAPTSSFQPLSDPMVEHRMYLPMVPCVALAVIGVGRVITVAVEPPRVRKIAGASIVAAAAGALGVTTHVRNLDYASAERMWTDVVAKAPHNPRGHYNLGVALLAADAVANEDRAFAEFNEALRLRPAYAEAHNNAGAILMQRGRRDEAAEHFRAAIASGDEPLASLVNYGRVLMEQRRFEEARDVLRRAEEQIAGLRDDPAGAARLVDDVGVCLLRCGAPGEALERFRHALELDPSLAGARTNCARALAATERVSEAIDAYLAAIAADPASLQARVELVALCTDARNLAAAGAHLEEVVRRDPKDAEARRALEFVRRTR